MSIYDTLPLPRWYQRIKVYFYSGWPFVRLHWMTATEIRTLRKRIIHGANYGMGEPLQRQQQRRQP